MARCSDKGGMARAIFSKPDLFNMGVLEPPAPSAKTSFRLSASAEVPAWHEARTVGPVFEQHPLPVHQAIQRRAVEGPETAPGRQVVPALQDVDRVELQAPGVLDEAAQALRAEAKATGLEEMLPADEPDECGIQTIASQ